MERCLHTFAMAQLKLVRKNKYELFVLSNMEQLDDIILRLDSHYQ